MAGLTPFFSIAIRHGYFADGICRPLALAPSARCATLLRRYGLLFRAAPGGGAVFCQNAALAASYDDSAPLDFIVTCNDPNLINYSAIDSAALSDAPGSTMLLAHSLFYADNLDAAPAAPAALTPALADAAIAVQTPVFLVTLAAPVTSARLTVSGADGQVCWSQASPPQAQSQLQIALAGLAPGRYSLQVDGATVRDFYLCERLPLRQFGALAIYPKHAVAAIAADGTLPNPQYHWDVDAASTLWRYQVSSASSVATWQLSGQLADGSTVAFTCTNAGAAQAPWTFDAARPIALAQTPGKAVFTLSSPPKWPGGACKVTLPYARGDVLVQPASPPGQHGYSDIYVYL